MSTRIALSQRFDYRFSRPVQLSTHWLRLRPAPHTRCSISAYSLRLDADPNWLNWLRDPFENHLARLDLPEPVAQLCIEMELIAELEPVNPFDFLVEPYASSYPFDYPAQLRKELAPYLRVADAGGQLKAWLKGLERTPGYIIEQLDAINSYVSQSLQVSGACKPTAVDVGAVLERGSGSAWELAWLLTLALRSVGLAARFSYGYLVLLDPDETADSACNHAWSEVFLPGGGWVGLDPAGGLFTNECYIPLASAPEPLRAVPIAGYREACEETAAEQIRLRRLVARSPSSPLSESQWLDIQGLGNHIDTELAGQNIAPSVARELGFVSADDANAPEWTVLAPGKRHAADELLQRLWRRLAPGGVLHVGQGESYAGESLPRWNLNCFARADGQPVWRDSELLARPGDAALKPGVRDVACFAKALAKALDVAEEFIIPAYEDGLHQLWTNRDLLDYMPSSKELHNPEQRRALAAQLSSSQTEAAGYVLPLRWDSPKARWASGKWRFRRDGLYLMPGASPIGYRLPLESLPVANGAPLESDPERCQFEERALLPEVYGEPCARLSTPGIAGREPEVADAGLGGVEGAPRTALCVEVRDGRLCVFMPPLTHLEHYLSLIAAVESAARETALPVTFEGYEPPQDCRLLRFRIEPDAGVLKVWLPEVHSWQQQCELLEATYEEAQRSGMRGERVMPDGRRVPPGGGAELTLAGTRPKQSPFLRRPELLRSLIVYWQRHPSLSYLFAGRSIGPGGNAPRVDEGRDESLYELSLALERIPAGEIETPWLPDRLLRHLLVDPAGDMARAEIRVDQLYAPERAGLRLGRVVLRSFETPPDARLAALQSLLVMGMLAFFNKQPQRAEFINWGAALHDRYMLPSMLWRDLCEILTELGDAGYAFQPEWFQPWLALRFPRLGEVQLGDIKLQLRSAHEPWPLLAEETTGAGVARFIDTANERLEVRATGLSPSRYLLVCNGRRVPLQATGVHGEYVAGVRYKVANPPSTLHPTIPAVDALVFDLIDRWNGRYVGGCTYIPTPPPIWGAVGAPAVIQESGSAPGRALPPLPPSFITAPWSSGGKFVPKGSGLSVIPDSVAGQSGNRPYLLDLNRAAATKPLP